LIHFKKVLVIDTTITQEGDVCDRLIDAYNNYDANPTKHGAYLIDYYELNLQLRKLACQWRCGEIEWDENTCLLHYKTYYDKWVKKWEHTHYYDNILASLNHFMNTVFGCNVDSPG